MALLYGMDRHQNPLVFIYQAENEKTKQHPRTYYFWAISQIKLIGSKQNKSKNLLLIGFKVKLYLNITKHTFTLKIHHRVV